MVARRQLVGELGAALQRYQRSVQAYDDAVGRALALGPADLRCLDWLADGPEDRRGARDGHRAAARRDHRAASTGSRPRASSSGCATRPTGGGCWCG